MSEKPTTPAQKEPAISKTRYTLNQLLAEAETFGAYPLPPEEREWVDAPPVGQEWPNDEK